MKTLILITAMICCSPHSKSAHPHSSQISVMPVFHLPELNVVNTGFSFVRGHKQGKNIAVTWGMNDNAGITHFVVVCTYEDPYDPYSVWRTVGMLPCTPRSPIFKIIDAPVLPGTLNYRIIAVFDNSSTLTSEIYTTYIQ